MKTQSFFLVLAMLFTPMMATAQAQPQKVKKGNRVWVYVQDSPQKYKGFLYDMSDSSLTLSRIAEIPAPADVLTDFSFREIQRIRIKKRNSTVHGLLLGGAGGFAIGGLAGLASGDDDSGFIRFSAEQNGLLGGILTSIPGAIVGLIAGASSGKRFQVDGRRELFLKAKADLTKSLLKK